MHQRSQEQRQPRRGRKAAVKDVLQKHRAYGSGLEEAAVSAREGSLKIGL